MLKKLQILYGEDEFTLSEKAKEIIAIAQKKVDDILKFTEENLTALNLKNEILSPNIFTKNLLIIIKNIKSSVLNDSFDEAFSVLFSTTGKFVIIIFNEKNIPKLEKRPWFIKNADNIAVVPVYKPKPSEVPAFLRQRFAQYSLEITKDAFLFFLHSFENNLLGSYQAIEKLYLLYGNEKPLSYEMIKDQIDDDAKFSVYNFIDALFSFNYLETWRIFAKLKKENTEPLILLWAITKELHTIQNIAFSKNRAMAFEKYRIWSQKQNIYNKFLAKVNSQMISNFLVDCQKIDQKLKTETDSFLPIEQLVKKFFLHTHS